MRCKDKRKVQVQINELTRRAAILTNRVEKESETLSPGQIQGMANTVLRYGRQIEALEGVKL